MKNIHILPTDKPSRIYLIKSNNKLGITSNNPEFTENFGSGTQNQHIYITSDEEIKEGVNQWYLDKFINKPRNSSGSQYGEKQDVIILTTDQDLIKDGVEVINDDFLEWFVKNPSCEKVEVVFNNRGITGTEKILKTFGEYKIIIPKEETKQEGYICPHTLLQCDDECCVSAEDCHIKEWTYLSEPKQETLEEDKLRQLFKNRSNCYADSEDVIQAMDEDCFIKTIKEWQQERMYSEEDIINALHSLEIKDNKDYSKIYDGMKKCFEVFKKNETNNL